MSCCVRFRIYMGVSTYKMVKEVKREEAVLIRRCEIRDLPQVILIERASFSSPWPEHFFYEELTSSYSHPFVAVIPTEDGGEKVVGYIFIWKLDDEIEIANIAVHPHYRNMGIATKLIKSMEVLFRDTASRVFLEVRVSNYPARNLYKKLGFKEIGIRRGYYTDTGEDAIVMMKEIGG